MPPFKHILVYVDSADAALSPALECALELAQRSLAEVKFVDVVEDQPSYVRLLLKDYSRMEVQRRQNRLERLAADARSAGLDATAKLLHGRPAVEIVREIVQEKHDLVVRGIRRQEGLKRLLIGTTEMRLLRNCPCPIWLVKHSHKEQRRIVASVDPLPHDEKHNELNNRVVELGCSMREIEQAELHIVSVWTVHAEELLCSRIPQIEFQRLERQTRKRARATLDRVLEHAGTRIDNRHIHFCHGEPAPVIVDITKSLDADLLIMGSVVRTGVPGLLIGNTAESVFRQVDCSVLSIKPEDFRSPMANREKELHQASLCER